MLPLIPASMAITILIAFTLFMDESKLNQDRPSVVAKNMLMQHQVSLKEQASSGLTSGSLGNMDNRIIRNMGDWQSAVFPGSGRKVIATWPGTSMDAEEMARAVAMFSSSDLSRLPQSQAGAYTFTHSGATVGDIVLDDVALPVDENTPVIVTVINDA